MVRLDLSEMNSRQANAKVRELIQTQDKIEVVGTHSIHNFATGLIGKGKFCYTAVPGFTPVDSWGDRHWRSKGNTGWYTGDNMMDGEIIVHRNTGSNAAPSMVGGNLIIKGSSGSRCGFGMKGGNLIVCGSVGRWCGGMTLGGRIVVLGEVGKGLGESMYKGIIHALDPNLEEKIGAT